MDSSIKLLTTVYISFSVTQHDVTHHPAYQPELLSSRTVSTLPCYFIWEGWERVKWQNYPIMGAMATTSCDETFKPWEGFEPVFSEFTRLKTMLNKS
jgi:hypothetical protein